MSTSSLKTGLLESFPPSQTSPFNRWERSREVEDYRVQLFHVKVLALIITAIGGTEAIASVMQLRVA